MAYSLIFLACKGNIEAYNRLMKDDVYRALHYPFQSLDSLGPEERWLALQYFTCQ